MKTFKDYEYFFIDENLTKKCACIEKGRCNVYLTNISEGKPVGKRYFLFSLEKGNLIIPIGKSENMKALAVPCEDMEIDENYNISNDENLSSRKLLLRIMAESLEWSKADIDNAVKNITEKNFDLFVSEYISKAVKLKKAENERKLKRNKDLLEKQKNTYYKSFDILSDSLKNKKQKKISARNNENIEDNLFKACRFVTEYMKIQIKVPLYIQKHFEVENPLEEIAFASHFRVRKVTLDKRWYKNASVSYIAYLKDGNVPVALTPAIMGYNIYNPETDTIKKVSKKIALQIDYENCYVVYRNLPSGQITGKDLLKFWFEGMRKADFIGMFLVGIAGGLLSALSPLIVSWIFDTVIPDANQTLLKQLAGILISVTCVQFIFEMVRSFAVMRIESMFDIDIQSSLWNRILSLPTTFFKKYSPGELAQKIDGVSQIMEIISGRVINQILSSIFGVFYIFVMFSISPQLALISMLVIILITVISLLLSAREVKYYKKMTDHTAELSGRMISWLNGITKIRTFNAESRVYNIWAKKFTDIREMDIQRTGIHNASQVFCSVVSVLVSMCMYFYIIKSNNFQLDTGMFVAFNTALMMVLSDFISLTETVTELNAVIPLYNNIKPILETKPEYDDTKEDIGEISGNIEVSHISFRYSDDTHLILKDVSFSIKQGEHIALVGTSGSGKSTMMRILLGFEKAENGQIYFDGKDISQFDVRSIRKQLGAVLQTGQLLPGSIFENVVGSSNTLTVEDVERALEMAGMLDEVNEMPMGIHTMVSDDFGVISGGQKQRILIARALVSNPKILFFDEATSALDNKTQKIVSDSINKLNITRITIAHRLSTITECDRIIVLDNGKIAEEGTYDELIDKKGIFYNMAKRQMF